MEGTKNFNVLTLKNELSCKKHIHQNIFGTSLFFCPALALKLSLWFFGFKFKLTFLYIAVYIFDIKTKMKKNYLINFNSKS